MSDFNSVREEQPGSRNCVNTRTLWCKYIEDTKGKKQEYRKRCGVIADRQTILKRRMYVKKNKLRVCVTEGEETAVHASRSMKKRFYFNLRNSLSEKEKNMRFCWLANHCAKAQQYTLGFRAETVMPNSFSFQCLLKLCVILHCPMSQYCGWWKYTYMAGCRPTFVSVVQSWKGSLERHTEKTEAFLWSSWWTVGCIDPCNNNSFPQVKGQHLRGKCSLWRESGGRMKYLSLFLQVA